MSNFEIFFFPDLAAGVAETAVGSTGLTLSTFVAAANLPRRRFDEFFRRDETDPVDVKLALLPTLSPTVDFLPLLPLPSLSLLLPLLLLLLLLLVLLLFFCFLSLILQTLRGVFTSDKIVHRKDGKFCIEIESPSVLTA
jgi:hypothetical protein